VLDDLSLVGKSTLGATVQWDLYAFAATSWHKAEGGQQLEAWREYLLLTIGFCL